MITRTLRVYPGEKFGTPDNPIWQVALVQETDLIQNTFQDWISVLTPLETLPDEVLLKLTADNKNKIELQSFISLENLKNPKLRQYLNQGFRVQIWIDRVVTMEEALELEQLLDRNNNIDLVYLPDQHAFPDEVFAHCHFHARLLIHMKLKQISFDRWLNPFDMWGRISWARECGKFSVIGTQVFENQISEFQSDSQRLFLLNPSYDNMMRFLKTHNKHQYWIQKSIGVTLVKMGPLVVLFVKQFIFATLQPSRKNWDSLFSIFKNLIANVTWRLKVYPVRSVHFGHRLLVNIVWRLKVFAIRLFYTVRSLKSSFLFYPLRKIYWFTEHQFKKRILGKSDESN